MRSTENKQIVHISLIIPLYNEEKRAHNLQALWAFVKNKSFIKELVIVNDGSTDKTLPLLKELGKDIPFKLISYKKNKGKGYAVRRGVAAATGTHVVFMDVDLSTPPSTLLALKKVITSTDIVIGTRKSKYAVLVSRQPIIRESLGRFFTFLSQTVLSLTVSDFTCGFKCFSKLAAQKIFAKQKIRRWAFDSESLYLAAKYGFSIYELPVEWKDYKGTKVRFPQDAVSSLVDLFLIRIYDLLKKY